MKKETQSTHTYSSCTYCGGTVEEQHTRTEVWIGERLILFENVPVGICSHCGEEYYRPDIHDKMLLLTKSPPKKNIEVAVYEFTDASSKATRNRKNKPDKEEEREEEIHLATDEEIRELIELDNEEDWDDL